MSWVITGGARLAGLLSRGFRVGVVGLVFLLGSFSLQPAMACDNESSAWGSIVDFFTDLVDAIGDFFSEIFDFIYDMFAGIFEAVEGFFSWLDGLNYTDPVAVESCSSEELYDWWYYEEGENPFTVSDGNASRSVAELEMPGTSGRKFGWTRYHNTVPKGYVSGGYLGRAGCWRHSWQFELLEKPAQNGLAAFLEFVSPAGRARIFRPVAGGGWAPADRFDEQLVTTPDGFDLIARDGTRLHFVAFPDSFTGGHRYEMQTLTDPHGLVTTLEYDHRRHQVTKVTDPAGRFFQLTYRNLSLRQSTERTVTGIGLAAPGADGWVEFTVPPGRQVRPYRHLRCVFDGGLTAEIAEMQFFAAGDTQPLTGTPLGAAAAFDGDPATAYVAADGGLCAFDLGSPKTIVRVRVKPRAGATLAGLRIVGLDAVPKPVTVLASVQASDGRSVAYDYEALPDPNLPYDCPALTWARYGDGTAAHYRYAQAPTDERPLLTEADDPRYAGRAKRIRYAYRTDRARPLGFIHQEINPATGGVYASLELDLTNPDKRIVHYSDLRTVSYLTPEATHGRPTERIDALGRKTTFEYADNGAGRLLAKVDHAGRRSELTYDEHGRILAEHHQGKLKKQVERDAHGRIRKTVDERGRATIFERDANGRIARFTQPGGRILEFGYNELGRVTTLKDRDGLHRFTYDARGNRTGWTNPRGQVITLGYDAQDRLVKITDPLARETRRELNDRGQPIRVFHRDGTTESFAYDNYGRKTASTDRENRTMKLAYDELGRVTRQEDPVGRVTTFDYTELPQGCGSCTLAPNATRIVGPDGAVTTRLYDTEGRLLAHTVASGTAEAATTLYAYDNDNNLVSTTDPLGHVTRHTYDDKHHRLTATDPLGRVTRWAYDEHGRNTSVTAPDGGVTRSEYDAQDRLIKTTDAAGNVTRREYDALGNIITLTDAAGKITRHTYDGKRHTAATHPDGKRQTKEYDAAGRPVRETSPDGGVTTRTYDIGNRVLTVSQSSPSLPSPASSAFTYDALGRRTSATDPLGRVTRWTYDAAGNVLAEIRPDGLQTSHTYDAHNRRTSTTDAAGNVTRFEYDVAANLTALTDARGNTYRFTYDARHRKTAMIYPDGSQETWAYDLAGRLAGYVNRAGQTKTIAYNAGGQPVSETWIDSVMVGGALRPDIPRPTTYQYDTAGRLTLLDNDRAKLAYTYDALGRVTSETSDLSALVPGLAVHTVRYGLDPLGRKSELTYPDGSKVSYDYDDRGRLESVNDGPGRAVGRYDYDPLGRIAKLTRDNNVVTSYAYDMAGQLTDIAHTKSNTVLAGTHYSLDQLGRRVAQTREDNITENYAYDLTGQLTGVDYGHVGGTSRPDGWPDREGFAYDPAGNRQATSEITNPQSQIKETTYTANTLNQYTQVGGVTFAYDANGNLTDDGMQHYTYDAQNRLISVQSSVLSASSAENIRAEFFYDARNRCVLRKFYSLGSQGQWILNNADSRALTYDTRWNLLAERTLNGTQVGKYIHGSRTDEILVSNLGSQILYPLADGLGSTVALSDQQGSINARFRYTAYGTPTVLNSDYLLSATGASLLQYRFLFTGREWLASVGLNEHRNRYMLATIGRWCSQDPIKFEGQDGNLYRYSRNMPVSLRDSFGYCVNGDSETRSVTLPELGFNNNTQDPITTEFEATLSISVSGEITPTGWLGNIVATITGTATASITQTVTVQPGYGLFVRIFTACDCRCQKWVCRYEGYEFLTVPLIN